MANIPQIIHYCWVGGNPKPQSVLYCIERDKSIEELTLAQLKEISPVFEEDLYDAVSLKTCVQKRLTIGAPGHEAMEQVIAINKVYLAE